MKYLHENNSVLASKLTDEITSFNLNKLETAIFTEVLRKFYRKN